MNERTELRAESRLVTLGLVQGFNVGHRDFCIPRSTTVSYFEMLSSPGAFMHDQQLL